MKIFISGDDMETREQKEQLKKNLEIINNLWRSL